VLTLVAGAVMASVVAAGPVVGSVVPGLSAFAAGFTGLVGMAAVLAVARSRRLRPPVTVPTLLVAGGAAGSIAATVSFLRREPAAAEYLPAPAAVYLAAVLVGCLWFVDATPRLLGSTGSPPASAPLPRWCSRAGLCCCTVSKGRSPRRCSRSSSPLCSC
jgi:hypothetical protein